MSDHEIITRQSDDERGSILRMVKGAHAAGILPRGVTVEQAYIIAQSALELTFPPMQALRTMHVIDGRLTMSAQAMLALAMRGGASVVYHESTAAVCDLTMTRGASAIRVRWTVDDAKRCGRWGKSGPWSQYPAAMLRNRAIADACRAIAPDLLAGMYDPDEIAPEPAPASATSPRPMLPGGAAVAPPAPVVDVEPELVSDDAATVPSSDAAGGEE